VNLIEVLRQQAEVFPQAPAIIEKKRTVTFGELLELSGKAAAFLSKEGIKAGDPILVLQPMSIELYVALLAIFRLGAIAMFLDPSAGRKHIEQCCEISPPRALIALGKAHLLRLISPALRKIPLKFSIGASVPGALNWKKIEKMAVFDPSIRQSSPEEAALLTFTSGSTGMPKAAVRSHGFLLTQHGVLVQSLELKPGEVDLTTLPIFVLANLASGVTSLLPDTDLRHPGKIDPVPVLDQIKIFSPSRTVASPALLERLADYCLDKGEKIPSFLFIFSGGAPVFPSLLDKLQKVAPSASVFAAYGSTEAEPIAHIARSEISPNDFALMLDGNGLLVGPPIPSIRLAVVPDRWGERMGPFNNVEFEKSFLDPGEFGEIVVAGDHVMKGYLNGEGDEETKFKVDDDVWHRTGDAGALDTLGRVWLFGRCSARIEDERGKVYPFAVECALDREPGIQRAAFLSVGKKRVLAVEKKESCGEISFDSLEWAHIDRVVLCKKIPVDKRHNAKIDYPALYRIVEELV
jgi:acyl-CoA synthetase (AMP-forming)/AMP-acid ligase II